MEKRDVLLIWDQCDYGIEFYLIPSDAITDEYLEILFAMTGRYINESNMEDLEKNEPEKLSLMVANPDTHEDKWLPRSEFKRFVGVFYRYKTEDSSRFNINKNTTVILSGFVP
jgi:hypothetical protein